MYVGDSSAGVAAGNYHTLRPGEAFEFSLDDTGADADRVYMDLQELWFDGQNTGDKLVVSYLNEESVTY